MKAFVFLLLFPLFLISSEEETIRSPETLEKVSPPLEKSAKEIEDPKEKIAPTLQGIVLTSDEKKTSAAHIRGVKIEDVTIPGREDLLKEKLNAYFDDQPLTIDKIDSIKKTIICHFRQNNRPLMMIDLPEQDISTGVVVFILIESKLDKLKIIGNKWFSDNLIKENIRLKPNKPIELDKVLDDVAWLNKNPFRRSDVLFSEGDRVNSTNVEIITKDRFPLRLYAGGDGTGTIVTGKKRVFAGLDWGYAFMCNQILSYMFTSELTSADEFQAHTAHYTAFLPFRHILTVFGGYAHTDPKIKDFDGKGYSGQASVRYDVPWTPLRQNWLLEGHIGFDYKIIHSNLLFIGIEPYSSKEHGGIVNVFQIVTGFTGMWDLLEHKVTFNTLLFWSPGRWLPHQKEQNFESFRSHASVDYVYATARLDYLYTYTYFSIALSARAQIAARTLITSEEMPFGGYDSVRGYNEREFLADNGMIINLEFRTPTWSPVKSWFFKKSNWQEELYFLAFADFGWGKNYYPEFYEDQKAHLFGFGPGVRYNVANHVYLRCDYGIKIHKTEFGSTARGKWHLGAMISF